VALVDEVSRCRERIHKTESTLVAHGILLTDHGHRLEQIAGNVDAMTRADEIAAEVAKRLRDERRVHFTKWQQIAATVAVLVGVADTVAHLVHP